jgi:cysteinyl-tRNA synthetase
VREVTVTDTLSGERRPVRPGADGVVGIYACGPTVYGRIHIGNARPFVAFTLLRRFLESEGYATRLVFNVTDVNDKIYAAAAVAGVGSAELASEMLRLYVEDTNALGLGRPDAEPLATDSVAQIIDLIEALIERGHAYESGGDVYFRVRSFDRYGSLSNRNPDDMDQGEEAGSASLKEDALDFALWKATKPGEDTSWESPWGGGRPGWHIECSAMAEQELGLPFAIHGGGSDLVFPHHENEIAQTVAGRDRPLAEIWMHNGMVLAGAEDKMSKSEGNFFLLHNAIEAFGAEAVVDYLISGHYRQPLAFGEEALRQSVARTERFRDFFRSSPPVPGAEDARVAAVREDFAAALADDFNTPRAMSALFGLVVDANKEPVPGARAAVGELLEIVGLGTLATEDAIDDGEAEKLLAQREEARAARDFERADALREELASQGFEIRDTADGPRLVRR